MKHQATATFWKAYENLPSSIRELANKSFDLLKQNPHHPSLHFKKVGGRWSVRIGRRHRALALEIEDGYLWYWIGSHDDYDRLIG